MFDAAINPTSASAGSATMTSDAQPDIHGPFRQAMRRHVAGVCVISAGDGERLNGMAVTSATSFSMEPPAVLVCVNETASLAPELIEGARFGLTVLGRGHEEVAAAFGRKPGGRARFNHSDWRMPQDGTPWLDGAPANLSCVVERRLTYGSHTAIVGRVLDVRLGPDSPSLVFRDGAYA